MLERIMALFRTQRDPEVLAQKRQAAVEIRRANNLHKEIAAIQRELERPGRAVKES